MNLFNLFFTSFLTENIILTIFVRLLEFLLKVKMPSVWEFALLVW